MAETTGRRPLKLMTALQPKQRQFTQYLLKTQKHFPLQLTQTPSHKIIINKKEIVHYCSTQFKKVAWLPCGHTKLSVYILPANKIKRYLNVFQPSDPPRARTSFIFHGVNCVLLLPSALSSARECGPQSTVTRVCVDGEKHADMTAVASLHRESERSKKKRKTRRQGVAVCVALRVSARPGRKENKTRGRKCVLRPTGPRRTPTRHGSLSAPFVAAPPHACSRRGAQGRRRERVGGCA
ncbi:hypothetical protein TCSYLVIO_000334, partial [Trypanosoma cruzi]